MICAILAKQMAPDFVVSSQVVRTRLMGDKLSEELGL
jgi:hypothetical protein